jgi:hypothetical protein
VFDKEIHGVIHKVDSGCKAEGDLVVMRLGNSEIKMSYGDSFKLSQMLRVAGKQAKINAGDVRRHWSVMGILDDANA